MGKIVLKGIKFHAFHGHYAAEKKVGSNFIVDVSVKVNTLVAESSDNLDDALDYQILYHIVEKEMSIPSDLLENIARRILDRIVRQFPEVEKVKLAVEKLHPAMGGNIGGVKVKLKYPEKES